MEKDNYELDPISVPCLTYVLECENDKWYIGKSYNVNFRLGQHLSGNGAKWTKLHKPKKIVGIYLGNQEKRRTLELMRKHGWQNVRGGGWCRVNLQSPPADLSP